LKLGTQTFRRGTLLLMVVGLLASLFMIISTFLTLARSDNRRAQITQHADQTQEILRTAEQVILSAIRQAWADGHGNLLTGGWKNPDLTGGSDVLPSYAPTNILGGGGTSWLGGAEWSRTKIGRAHV
jgi:cellobiose-specific phosphotransferase system component IIC